MAKQKKVQARRVPRASEPRMYGDGKPSEATENAQPASSEAAKPAVRSSGARSAGVTPRVAVGAGGSYLRGALNTIADYTYVRNDLRRLGIMAASILSALVVLSFFLH